MTPFVHRIYASHSSPEFKEYQIPALLERARAANAQHGITGILLYVGAYFLQLLEGHPVVVDALYDRIVQDPRHTHVTLIAREPIAQRGFDDWSMGFSTVDRLDAGGLIGERDFFQSGSWISHLDTGRAKKLLFAFGHGRWRLERTGDSQAVRRRV
jgi:hypothetical protein